MRASLVALTLAAALGAVAQTAPAQHPAASLPPPPPRRQGAVHYGKWLTAGAAAALTVLAAREHSSSRRAWDELLAICRSTDNACARGGDGRYVRADAEALYQRSVYYDRRANRRLLGAQGSLLATAALFILDLRGRTSGPGNIPFSPLEVGVEPATGAARVGLSFSF
jgi:hypothetical protein